MSSHLGLELQMIMTDYSFLEFFSFGKGTEKFNKASVNLYEDADAALQETLECILLVFCDVCMYVDTH